jgi:hypothetical protein
MTYACTRVAFLSLSETRWCSHLVYVRVQLYRYITLNVMRGVRGSYFDVDVAANEKRVGSRAS